MNAEVRQMKTAAEVALGARRAVLGGARRLVGRGGEVDVAAAALATLGQHEALAVGVQIGDQLARRLIVNLRAGWNAQHEVFAAAAASSA